MKEGRTVICAVLVIGVVLLPVALSQCGCRRFGKRSATDNENVEVFGDNLTQPINGADEMSKIVDGDMVFRKEDFDIFNRRSKTRVNLVDLRKRWPNGIVYYAFDRVAGNVQNYVRNALARFSQLTNNCIRFQQVRLYSNMGHVRVYHGVGCHSLVGRTGRVQDLSLGRGCVVTHIIQHEFMHALGFFHEQSRPDRDRHIRIHWGNIQSHICHNFNVCRGCTVTTGYDISSVMQYASGAGSCNGRPTMTDLQNRFIRENKAMTRTDVLKVKKYYGCR